MEVLFGDDGRHFRPKGLPIPELTEKEVDQRFPEIQETGESKAQA